MRIAAYAPSNIALVKYMGKLDPDLNLPAHPSLSLTLNHLRTWVELEAAQQMTFSSDPLHCQKQESQDFPWKSPQLSAKHLTKVHQKLDLILGALEPILKVRGLRPKRRSFLWRTANTFAPGAGMASSASSIAALTLASAAWLCQDELSTFSRIWEQQEEFREALSSVSRLGSGSSCRSFTGPWVSWQTQMGKRLDSPLQKWADLILVVSEEHKIIGSSEAHLRVKTSPFWSLRTKRATSQWESLSQAILKADVQTMAQIAWQELWEMHSLFHTSEPPFTYLKPKTLEILQVLEPFVKTDSLIVTLDAGPNVHILVPHANAPQWKAKLSAIFPDLLLLVDQEGTGANWRVYDR